MIQYFGIIQLTINTLIQLQGSHIPTTLLRYLDVEFYNSYGILDKSQHHQAFNLNDIVYTEWFHEQGYRLPNNLNMMVKGPGSLDILKYVMETGFYSPHNLDCAYLACHGLFDQMKYLHETWSVMEKRPGWTCSNAIANGHIDCLVYAYNHGFVYNPYLLYKTHPNCASFVQTIR